MILTPMQCFDQLDGLFLHIHNQRCRRRASGLHHYIDEVRQLFDDVRSVIAGLTRKLGQASFDV